MLAISGNARIFFCTKSIDMRNGFEGLSGLVESLKLGELTSGAYFVFLNRQRDKMKVLYWDGDGLVIWYKRLERGTFRKDVEAPCLDRRSFFMLLEDIVPRRLGIRFKIA